MTDSTRIVVPQKHVSITFDDGPTREYTPRILNVLKSFRAKATFFVVGKNARENPDIIQRIVREGHDLGNHTYSHFISTVFKKKVIEEEIRLTEKIIKEITGQRPSFFRSPCWAWDVNAEKVVDVAKNLGYCPVKWSISSVDWLGVRKIIKYKIFGKTINHREIFLFHDGAETCPVTTREATVELLPDVLNMLNEKQMSPVRLSDLREYKNKL